MSPRVWIRGPFYTVKFGLESSGDMSASIEYKVFGENLVASHHRRKRWPRRVTRIPDTQKG